MSNGFLKGTAWASFANLFFLATGYVAQILIGRSLSPADFGSIGVAIYFLNLIEYVVTTGISLSLSKFVAERPAAGWSVIRHSLRGQIFTVILISVPLWLLAPQVAGWFNDQTMSPLLQVVAIILPFYGIRSLLQGILGGQREFTAQAKVKIIIAVIKLILIVTALVLNTGIVTILLAYLFSSLVGSAFGWHYVRPVGRAETLPAKVFYRYAISLTVFLVVFPLFINVDVFLVKRLVSPADQVGWYVAATTLARLPFYLFTGVLLTLLPSVAHLKKEGLPKLRRLIQEVNRYALLLLVPLTVVVAVTADALVPLIFGPSYQGGGNALAILIVGVSCLVMFRIFSTVLVGLTSPALVTITTTIIIVVDLILNLLLIPRFGIVGAASASTVASVIGLIAAAIQLRRQQLATIDWQSFKNAAAASAIIGALLIIHPTNWSLFIVVAAAAILYGGLLFVFKEIQSKDGERLRSLIRRDQTEQEPTAL